jgi:arabinofuranosyltransferase
VISAAAMLFYLHFMARGSVMYDGRTYFTLFDDAMISMKFAKTLAAGGGFTWNPGELPIEGITNPLWTVWMALLHFAPVPEGYVALLVGLSSAACLIGTAFAARELARRLGATENLSLFAMAMVAFYYPLAFWSLRGMETGVLACLMAWAIVLVIDQLDAPTEERNIKLAAIAVALVWVRQDAVVFIVTLAAFTFIAGGARSRRTAAALVGAMVLALALLTLFRLGYYGSALPNTYTLKVTGVTLFERLDRGFSSLLAPQMRSHFFAVAVAVLLSIPVLIRTSAKQCTLFALPLVAFLAQAAYSVYVGGDVWELMGYPNRYLVIAMPGLLVLAVVLMTMLGRAIGESRLEGRAARLLERLPIGLPLIGKLVPVVLVTVLLMQTTVGHAVAALRNGPAYVDYDRAATQVGLCLRKNTEPDARIAYTWAGAMPYYADRFGIDLLGKMDAYIANSKPQIDFQPGHNKWDYAYSIDAHRPDIVLQLFRAKPGDHDRIMGRGYTQMKRSWPCLSNTFLTPEDVFVRAN